MKESNGTTSIDGEDFGAGLTDGYKVDANTVGPFKRSLPYIEARKDRLFAEGNGNFRRYDETNTVNQG